MVQFISGDEPYMISSHIRKCIGTLSLPELNLLKSSVIDEGVYDFLLSCPIGDDYKVAVVHLSQLKDADNEYVKSFMKENSTNRLLIRIDDYDARTSFYKDLKKRGLLMIFCKSDIVNHLEDFCIKKASEKGAVFSDGIISAMVQRCSFVENDEVNLYSIAGFVNSMASLSKIISMETMEAVVPLYEKDETFGIAKMIVSKDVVGIRTQAEILKGDEIRCLSALLREYRISYKAKYYPVKEIGVMSSVFLQEDKDYLISSINMITDVIAGIKRGTVDKSSCLLDTFMRLLK